MREETKHLITRRISDIDQQLVKADEAILSYREAKQQADDGIQKIETIRTHLQEERQALMSDLGESL